MLALLGLAQSIQGHLRRLMNILIFILFLLRIVVVLDTNVIMFRRSSLNNLWLRLGFLNRLFHRLPATLGPALFCCNGLLDFDFCRALRGRSLCLFRLLLLHIGYLHLELRHLCIDLMQRAT